jgi:hypothetical protein
LQVAPEEQLELVGGLLGVPAGDRAADQLGQLGVEVLGEVSDARLEHLLGLVLQHRVVAKPRAACDHEIGKPAAQLGVRRRGLDPQRRLDLAPQPGRPLPHCRVGEQLVLEVLASRVEIGCVLEAVDEGRQPLVEAAAQLVMGVAGDVGQQRAQAHEEPFEDAVLDRAGKPPRRLVLELGS